MSLNSEIEYLEWIVLLNSTVFPGYFDIIITILAEVVTKIGSVEGSYWLTAILRKQAAKFWDAVVN